MALTTGINLRMIVSASGSSFGVGYGHLASAVAKDCGHAVNKNLYDNIDFNIAGHLASANRAWW